MTSARFTSSRPPEWVLPRPHRDPGMRRQHFGPLVPMEQPPSLTSKEKLSAAALVAGLAVVVNVLAWVAG